MTALGDFQPKHFVLRCEEDLAVVEFFQPQLTEEDNIEELAQELFAVVDHYGARKVVLSLRSVGYMTSSILGKIITLHRKLGRTEGRLVLCEISEAVREILHTANLLGYFRTAETQDDARTMIFEP